VNPTKKLIREVFENVFSKTFNFDSEFTRAQEESWDSLQHIRLIVALEAAINRALTDEEITKINSLQSALLTLSAEDN
jgi:acyl carrier protein